MISRSGSQTGRIHPFVMSKAVRENNNFTENILSASTGMSLKSILVVAAAIASFLLLLMLMG